MTDFRSAEAAIYRRRYGTTRWRHVREAQLSAHPLCQYCLERDEVTEATDVHHSVPHKGNEELFWSGPFVSLCHPCHSRDGQLEDKGRTVVRYGADGWPL